jgi:hypothetical protein
MISLVDEAEYGFAVRLIALAEAPLALEKVCPHPGRIGESGLESILGGVELVRSKLVYQVWLGSSNAASAITLPNAPDLVLIVGKPSLALISLKLVSKSLSNAAK